MTRFRDDPELSVAILIGAGDDLKWRASSRAALQGLVEHAQALA
jgi:hypothetical protein